MVGNGYYESDYTAFQYFQMNNAHLDWVIYIQDIIFLNLIKKSNELSNILVISDFIVFVLIIGQLTELHSKWMNNNNTREDSSPW